MKRFLALVLLGVALLALPDRSEAHVGIGAGFRGGFGGFRNFGFNRFNYGFNNFAFNGYGFNNGFYGGGYGYSSFASVYSVPVTYIQLVPAYVQPTVAVQQVAYSAPAVQVVAEAQPLVALPVFQQVYAAQSVYQTPVAFANACYGSPLLFNAHFGRHGHSHAGFFGGGRRR